jgi:outer membrane protein assembly factor BamB
VRPAISQASTVILGQHGIGARVIIGRQSIGTREPDAMPNCFPVVVDRQLIFADAEKIGAVNVHTGEPAITANGTIYQLQSNDSAPQATIQIDAISAVAHGSPRYSLSVRDGIVYGRVGTDATSRVAKDGPPDDRLIGFDLHRDGLLSFKSPPESAGWSFDGVPLCENGRLFVAMRHSDVTPHAYVACLDAATGSQLWRTAIGAADTPAAGAGDEVTHNLLTIVGDRIYFNTNLGLVAALDKSSGRVCWIRRYDRSAGKHFAPGQAGPHHFLRDPSPCLVHSGLVIVAPSDSPQVFALDAETGQLAWASMQMGDALHLLGVVHGRLLVGGNRLRSVDVSSGKVKWAWPDSEHAGIRGMGRGLIAGDEIFWPTRSEIYVLNAATGERTRTPISLSSVSNHGANLAVAYGRLVVAGTDKLMVFGPASAPRENDGNVQLSSTTRY